MAPPKESFDNPVLRANIFSRLSFWWMNKLFRIGYKRDLEFSDMYDPLPKDRSDRLGEKLCRIWENEVKKCRKKNEKRPGKKKPYRPSLLRALIRQFGCQYMFAGFLLFMEECVLRMAQPLLLGQLIRYFSGGHKPVFNLEVHIEGNLLAGAVVLSAVASIYVHHAYFFRMSHVGMRCRVACSSAVFRKSLRLSQAALGETTAGQFVNLLSNDVSRFEMGTIFCHYFWIGPIQTITATAILWYYFQEACLAGLFILIIFIPFQALMGKRFSKLRSQTAIKTDKRVRIMSEIVNGMRVIKLYAWEKHFSALIAESRKDEVNVIRKTSTLKAINTSLFFASSKLIIFSTLLTYVLLGNDLTAEKVFVSLALYNNIRLNMTLFFPNAISSFAEALVSIRRIEDILLMEEKETQAVEDKDSTASIVTSRKRKGVIMEHFSGKWHLAVDETLADITFKVGPGQLYAIIGQVGSGKGTVLQAILRELPATFGTVTVHGKVAYTSQDPWVFAGSIRQNILFGSEYNAEWYDQVVESCALNWDLSLLPYGDRTLIGDRGASLSGGQKARINLARAVYSDADIYLLDDPLSAVDVQVGKHIFDKCINGMLKYKVRILVTHQLQFLTSSTVDHIILLQGGQIQMEGKYKELVSKGVDFNQLMRTNTFDRRQSTPSPMPLSKNSIGFSFRRRRNALTSLNSGRYSIPRHEALTLGENSLFGTMYAREEIVAPGEEEERNSIKAVISLAKHEHDPAFPEGGKSTGGEVAEETIRFVPKEAEEGRATGNIKLSLYYKYLRAGSTCFTMFMLFFFYIISQLLFTGADYWLKFWTEADRRQEDRKRRNDTSFVDPNSLVHNDELQVYVYAGIVAALFVAAMCRTILFFRISLNSSVNLHNAMFQGIIRAPLSFFETNRSGRILNRFSSSIGDMDDALPPCFYDAVGILLNVIAIVILVGVVKPILLAPAAVLAIILYFLRSFYLRTARSIKRLEGVSRSPVYSHLSSALYGLPTIRAFGAENLFIAQFDDHMNLHTSTWFVFLASTRWFGYYLDWISTSFIAAVTFSFMIGGTSDGPTVGLIISSVIQLSGMFQWGIRQSAEVENQMISVERVMEYTKIKPEAALESEEGKKPPPEWPTSGEIRMSHLCLQYKDSAVLKNITCVFHPSEKVGIVGRTGAGKSSLITALFRLSEPTGEIYIDGINVLQIGLHDLRAKISIIPQDPVLFMGSLRKNLDPFNNYKDVEIWDVLEQVQLAADIKTMPSGLDYEVTEGGANFSVGQRQLVCLARAILKQSKILVLDEATANVDPETDALIQNTIRKNFINCTVLTVAHRLNTVMDSDRILVMDAGEIVEFEEPFLLLQDRGSELTHLVQVTGKESADNLYAMAKKAMQGRQSTDKLIKGGPKSTNLPSRTQSRLIK